ncbi:MAG: GerMN domain-containing protein [Thermodesulfovibrionales bacterium]|nr:GerMN domain-containing protein [Thermodesulfovibrionales bacterium]
MKSKYLIIAILLVFFSGLSGWFVTKYYFLSMKGKTTQDSQTPKSEPLLDIKPDGRHSLVVKIFYPSSSGVHSVEKRIYTTSLSINITEEVLKEFLKELKGQLSQVRLLGVYRDMDDIVYVDLSDEIRRQFSGDAEFEYNLLKSLLDTVLTNVPNVKDVKILIEGKEIESIGGHFLCLKPLKSSLALKNE